MQNLRRKALKLLTSTAVVSAMLISNVGLVAAADTPFTYEPVNGETFTFEKTLKFDTDAILPDITFEFKIVGGDAITATTTEKVAVYSGTDSERVEIEKAASIEDVKFGAADTGTTGEATKEATVDLSGVFYKEPGVYRYVITEKVNDENVAHGISYDETPRYLDVYVEDDGNDALEVKDYVLHTVEDFAPDTSDATDPVDLTDKKSDGFTNEYDSDKLTIALDVTGNQASRDEYFKVTINIENAIPGTEYKVDLSDADATTAKTGANPSTHTNPDSIKVGTDGTVTATFWLQNGQNVDILGLSDGTKYTVTVTNEGGDLVADGYSSSVVSDPDDEGAANEKGDTFKDTDGIQNDTEVKFTLKKNGLIPTGVMLAVAPAAAVVLVGGLGVTGLVLKNRKKNEEE